MQLDIEMNKKGNAYDILKLAMACLIVAMHSKAFYGPWCIIWVKPIQHIAVPIFFILSSMFYFKKLKAATSITTCLLGFLKRLGFLYLFWFIINIPFIYIKYHSIFDDSIVAGLGKIAFDVLFTSTYNGSWFFSALAFAITLITFVYNKRYLKILLITISILILFYVNCIQKIPQELRGLYYWWTENIRDDARMTLLGALPWVSVGVILSENKVVNWIESLHNRNLSSFYVICFDILCCFLLVLSTSFGDEILCTTMKLITSFVLVVSTGLFNIEPKCIYYKMRQMSTLIFMIHFIVIKTAGFAMQRLPFINDFGHIGYYFIILFLSISISLIYLRIQSHRLFSWLKYGF